jgi:hypothetical protein
MAKRLKPRKWGATGDYEEARGSADSEDPHAPADDSLADPPLDRDDDVAKKAPGMFMHGKAILGAARRRLKELPLFLKTLGSGQLGIVLFQLVLQALALAVLLSSLGTVVYYKDGLTISWLGTEQAKWSWARGRNGALHILTLFESIWVVAPQVVILMTVAGSRSSFPRVLTYAASVVLNPLAAIFAALKLAMHVVLLPWCSSWPDCTDEDVLSPDARAMYLIKMAACGLLILGFVLNTYIVRWSYEHSDAKDEDMRKRMPVTHSDNMKAAAGDIAYVLLMLSLQAYALLMLLSTMCSVVYPTTGLTISWLDNAGRWSWVKDRFGAQHILLFFEAIYLIGPQAAICAVAVGHRLRAACKAFDLAAHFFVIAAIIVLVVKLIVFFVMLGNCSSWPECTTEIVGSTAVSGLFIARIVQHAILFFLYILAEFSISAFGDEVAVRHGTWFAIKEGAKRSEAVQDMQDKRDESVADQEAEAEAS